MAFGFPHHPLEQIVNVHWGRVDVYIVDEYMDGQPSGKLDFAFHKKADDGTHTLAVPDFGNTKNLPTVTQTFDQTIHFLAPRDTKTIITGGAMQFAVPRRRYFTSRGFLIFQNHTFQANPHQDGVQDTYQDVGVPGSYSIFDPHGNPTTKDKIPKEDSKGLAIASDDNESTSGPATWYMSADQGLRKLDSNGALIGSITPQPDTVSYDSVTKKLKVVWFSGAPDGEHFGQGEIAWYDLDGTQTGQKIIGEAAFFDGNDCSRKGRVYGLLTIEGGRTPDNFPLPSVYSIEAYDYDGSHLFSIPPIGGINTDPTLPVEVFLECYCYGEDYIVATTFKQTQGHIDLGLHQIPGAAPGFFERVVDAFTINHQRRLIYDAKTGALVNTHDYGEMRFDSTQMTTAPGETTNTQTISAYNLTFGVFRNDYFPSTLPLTFP